jgi:aldehyde dehydrogenase (NAD+)
MTHSKPFFLAGEWRTGTGTLEVRNPYDGSDVASVGRPADGDIEDALVAAGRAFEESRMLPGIARADALDHISRRLGERTGAVADLIAREGGKPLKWAKVEAERAVSTFRWAAEEARRADGQVLRLDADPVGAGRIGIVRRFPVGPVVGITPFNFPVNLVAHKVAPALAAGVPIIVKPAPATPLGALLLAELFAETDLPKGMLSVLPVADPARIERLASDERVAVLSFTGSTTVGWHLKGLVPRKRVVLELGGNAACVVHSDADLDNAAARVAVGGYYQAGQSCVKAQRILVHAPVYDDFLSRLLDRVASLEVGDPLDPATDVGPLISTGALDRVAEWVDEAVSGGAEVLAGGKRRDPFYEPTVLANTGPDMKVRREEIFGPVVTVQPYDTFEEALAEVNGSRYGLHAGVFTSDLARAFLAHRELRVGGVIVNDVPAYRADQMPYGGSKDSGVGREGLRYAIEELTESRILVLSSVPV